MGCGSSTQDKIESAQPAKSVKDGSSLPSGKDDGKSQKPSEGVASSKFNYEKLSDVEIEETLQKNNQSLEMNSPGMGEDYIELPDNDDDIDPATGRIAKNGRL